ncbi:MAG: hypothetical protein PHO08_20580 [Methylococcales bacterium]|nr:hypothetical protein [Methylococcales bacterium]
MQDINLLLSVNVGHFPIGYFVNIIVAIDNRKGHMTLTTYDMCAGIAVDVVFWDVSW